MRLSLAFSLPPAPFFLPATLRTAGSVLALRRAYRATFAGSFWLPSYFRASATTFATYLLYYYHHLITYRLRYRNTRLPRQQRVLGSYYYCLPAQRSFGLVRATPYSFNLPIPPPLRATTMLLRHQHTARLLRRPFTTTDNLRRTLTFLPPTYRRTLLCLRLYYYRPSVLIGGSCAGSCTWVPRSVTLPYSAFHHHRFVAVPLYAFPVYG